MEGLDVGWTAASTALSACLYLLDLGTTISTLITYYRYMYYCPHAPSSLLLRDPICRAIGSGYSLQPIALWDCLFLLAVAHLTYALMFWISLDRRQHPLRLAYFMPLIQLYRLFKLLWHSFSSNGLKELQNSQLESTSLYSALGASLETVPQFLLQFQIIVRLEQFLKGSSDPSTRTQTIPTNLMVSLVASMVSAVYNASMAVWFIMRKQHVSLARKACVSTTAGCQAFVIILSRAMFVAAISEFFKSFPIYISIYFVLVGIVAWSFMVLLLRSHCDSQGRSKFVLIAHSFGFALITSNTGPIYMVVKLGESARHLIWGTLLHIFVEIIWLTLFLSLPSVFPKWNSPCHFSQITSKYLTCKVFLGTILPSLFVLLLTSIFVAWVHVKNGKYARVGSRAPGDIVCSIQPLETFEEITSQQRSMYNFKKLLLLILMTILFVQKLQKKYVL